MSIPCVAGPYTTINCSLRLLSNSVRINTSLNSGGNYEHENDQGFPIDDDRFRTHRVPVTAIATSRAQNDSGLFELNFRDERYLPFEGSGAISEWQIELSTDKALRSFDYATIADVILHMDYTARENGGLFKEKATTYIKDFLANTAGQAHQPLMLMISMRHDFPTQWHRFLHPAVQGGEQILQFTLSKQVFPFLAHNREVVVQKLDLFARRIAGDTDYHAVLSYADAVDNSTVTSATITLPRWIARQNTAPDEPCAVTNVCSHSLPRAARRW